MISKLLVIGLHCVQNYGNNIIKCEITGEIPIGRLFIIHTIIVLLSYNATLYNCTCTFNKNVFVRVLFKFLSYISHIHVLFSLM